MNEVRERGGPPIEELPGRSKKEFHPSSIFILSFSYPFPSVIRLSSFIVSLFLFNPQHYPFPSRLFIPSPFYLVDLSLVTDLAYGQSIPSYVQNAVFRKSETASYCFALLSADSVSENSALVEFLCESPIRYSEWTDGFNMLFDKNIANKDTAEYIQQLTDIGLKLCLLDIHGERIDFNNPSPEVPPDLPMYFGIGNDYSMGGFPTGSSGNGISNGNGHGYWFEDEGGHGGMSDPIIVSEGRGNEALGVPGKFESGLSSNGMEDTILSNGINSGNEWIVDIFGSGVRGIPLGVSGGGSGIGNGNGNGSGSGSGSGSGNGNGNGNGNGSGSGSGSGTGTGTASGGGNGNGIGNGSGNGNGVTMTNGVGSLIGNSGTTAGMNSSIIGRSGSGAFLAKELLTRERSNTSGKIGSISRLDSSDSTSTLSSSGNGNVSFPSPVIRSPLKETL